jgi:uncharacterized protein
MTATATAPAHHGPELPRQTVVVIGGSSGIGLAIARRTRAEGADARPPNHAKNARPPAYSQAVALESEKYVLFTTFRRDGRAVSTPVWLVQLPEGRFGFSTGSDSGKAKRLRHTARITLQACDRSGSSPHGPVLDGQAHLVSGTELKQIQSAIKGKYGPMATALAVAATLARRLGGKRANAGRIGVVISLTPALPIPPLS